MEIKKTMTNNQIQATKICTKDKLKKNCNSLCKDLTTCCSENKLNKNKKIAELLNKTNNLHHRLILTL